MRNRDYRPEPKRHRARWLTVLLDLWFLFGFVLGHQTQSYEAFLIICISGAILTITHLMFVLK
ncbi:hypothetical protein [Dictyobacter aurantiacus]|uniref:Uncharacterized protein n=1 Tax=Dictyobacter aurantiacus TaxID=1936993 RepID=A0A401ZBL5_9CHLR|nr:hypothetical protein [Dictyobacter aurantiacus]GCE04232.1 hypothetical protein KDAU_15610 [Dictyobacter aurantiacus]